MTIETQVSAVDYQGNGATTQWDYKFLIPETNGDPNFEVFIVNRQTGVITNLELMTDFTITGLGAPEGGVVTYPLSGAPLSDAFSIVIRRTVPYIQPVDLQNQGGFYLQILEDQLDFMVMQSQQLKEQVDRAVTVPITTSQEELQQLAQAILSLGAIIDDVQTVAGISTEVTVVAGIANEVSTVAAIAPQVSTVAGIEAEVTTVAGVAPSVETVAQNVTSIHNFADVYQGPKPGNPSQRNDGTALQPGDLFFDTTLEILKYFDGTSWRAGTGDMQTSAYDPDSWGGRVFPYESRADAEAATIPAPVLKISVIHNGQLLDYVRDAAGTALTTADGATWSPAGKATFQHWGAVGGALSDDSAAVTAALVAGKVIDGLGLTYAVSAVPADFKNIRNAAFLVAGITYRTDDYLDVAKYQITKTLTYTCWTQDKACVDPVSGIWIVPYQLAHGHEFANTQIAWSWSYDKGQAYTHPEIILDKHPERPTKGWNCFSAGVVGSRFVMFAEERDVATRALLRCIMRDRVLDRTYRKTNGIALTSGSSIATIYQPNHGLVAGDTVAFSGTNVAGLSADKSVASFVDADHFTVDTGTVAGSDQPDTGGEWILAYTFYNNDWRETVLPDFANSEGNLPTHYHSLAVKNGPAGEFFIGFHNGSNAPREVGAIHVEGFFTTSPSFTKKRFPATYEASAAEPCVKIFGGRLYATTRSQDPDDNGSSFGYSDDDGDTWTFHRLPGNLHYTPLPFAVYQGDIYIFGTERAENEWGDGTPLNRYNINRPRSFMLRAPVAELEAGNFDNLTTTVLGYDIYQGESGSPGTGVGSVIFDEAEGKLVYTYGSEDLRTTTTYSLNLPDIENEFLADGYQPDIYAYEVTLKKPRGGNVGFDLRGPDMQAFPVYQKGNERHVTAPIIFDEEANFQGGLQAAAVNTADLTSAGATVRLTLRVCPVALTAAATLVCPANYSLYKITPPTSGAGAVIVTSIDRPGTKEGDEIVLVTTTNSGDPVTIADGGFQRLSGDRSLTTAAKVLTLVRVGSYWQEKGFGDN